MDSLTSDNIAEFINSSKPQGWAVGFKAVKQGMTRVARGLQFINSIKNDLPTKDDNQLTSAIKLVGLVSNLLSRIPDSKDGSAMTRISKAFNLKEEYNTPLMDIINDFNLLSEFQRVNLPKDENEAKSFTDHYGKVCLYRHPKIGIIGTRDTLSSVSSYILHSKDFSPSQIWDLVWEKSRGCVDVQTSGMQYKTFRFNKYSVDIGHHFGTAQERVNEFIEKNRKFISLGFDRSYMFLGPPGCGKCVDENTLIMDAESGILKPVKTIVKQKNDVFTFDKNQGLVPVTPSAWLDTGSKECLTLETHAGHSITATPEHPVLTTSGWKRLDELNIGDYIAAAAEIPFPKNTVSIPKDHIILMAGLITEGCYTPSQVTVGFSNTNPEIINLINKSLSFMDGYLYQYDSMSKCEWRIRSKVTNGKAEIWSFLERYGLGRKFSTEKTIPEIVFKLGPKQLALFLGVLWSCDGSVEANGCITLGMSSKVLVQQVQHLLLRLGIRSNFKYKPTKYNGKIFNSWRITVTSSSKKTFADTIPLFGEKRHRIHKINLISNPNDDTIPLTPFVIEKIKTAIFLHKSKRGTFAKIRDALNWKKVDAYLFTRRKSLSRKMFRIFLDEVSCPDLEWMLQVRWERVEKLEDAGIRRVYDLTVPDTHNFLAADIVAHNTTMSQHFARAYSGRILQFSPEVIWNVGDIDIIKLIEESGANVVLIDELDKLMSQLGHQHKGMLLSRIEKMRKCKPGLITIITANSVRNFPDAMLRPGRIDDIIEFSYPDEEDRKKILQGYANLFDVAIESDVINRVAGISEGLTGAWLKEVVMQMKVSDPEAACNLIEKMLKYAKAKDE